MNKEKDESNIKILSPIDREEANRKIRRIIKKLEDWGWHPYLQKMVKDYCEFINKYGNVTYNGKEQTLSYFFHNTLTKELFQYRNHVNFACLYYNYKISVRKKLIIFLGPKCVFCGNKDVDLLDIDHKTNNGSDDRKWEKDTGVNLYSFYWNNLVDAYINLQILCSKCHKLKTRGILIQSHIEEKLNNEVKQLEKKQKK